MRVAVRLHSVLRDHLPPEARGRGTITLGEGSTVADLLAHLDITRAVVVSINGAHAGDLAQVLRDGDAVEVFTAVAGG